MTRLLASSASLAFLAVLGAAQTYVQQYAAGTAYAGVNGDRTRFQLLDADGGSRLVDASGGLVRANAGFFGAMGVGGSSDRQFLGYDDSSYPLPVGYVRMGDPDAYSLSLGSGTGLLRGATDSVTGRIAFLALDTAAGTAAWGIDTGVGQATPVASALAPNGVGEVTSISDEAFTALGYDSNFSAVAFWNDALGDHAIPLPAGYSGFQQLYVNASPGGAAWITAIGVRDGGAGDTDGLSATVSGGVLTWSDLVVDGAVGATQPWGPSAAFWTPGQAFDADLSSSLLSEIRTAGGDPLSGVASGFTRAGAHYLSGSFGAGSVQAVPEPAALAALGLGALGASRRRAKR